MKKLHVVFSFIHLSIPDKIAMGRNVIAEMRNNPSFPNPDVSMENLIVLIDALEVCYLNSRNGGKEQTVLLHQAEAAWDNEMRKLARYVERVADENAAIVLSAGFSLAKQPIPAQRTEFSVEAGKQSGSVVLRRQAVRGAKSYIWQYCIHALAETDEGWKIAEVTGKASVELTNLQPVTKYWFRVAAVNSTGTSAYNDPIMHMVT